MTIPGGLNMMCLSQDARTYAKFSAARTHANLTLSNNNLTCQFGTTQQDTWHSTFLDQDKTSGIWSWEVKLESITPLAGAPLDALFSTVLTDGNVGALNYSSACFSVYSGGIRTNNATTLNVYDVATEGVVHLCLFDFNNRKFGSVKNGSVVWAAALGTNQQLYIGTSIARSSSYPTLYPKVTINTGQTAFSAANKTILAGISGANEGVWI